MNYEDLRESTHICNNSFIAPNMFQYCSSQEDDIKRIKRKKWYILMVGIIYPAVGTIFAFAVSIFLPFKHISSSSFLSSLFCNCSCLWAFCTWTYPSSKGEPPPPKSSSIFLQIISNFVYLASSVCNQPLKLWLLIAAIFLAVHCLLFAVQLPHGIYKFTKPPRLKYSPPPQNLHWSRDNFCPL